MKKSIFFTVSLVFLMGTFAKAQTLETWTWDSYHMKFKVPSDFEVLESTGEKFSAGNYDINLTIYPEKVSDYTYDKMKSSLRTWTTSNNVVPDSKGYQYLEDLNGYWGCMVDGYKGESQIFLMMIHDPDYNDIACYVWLAYNQKSYDTALAILKSFTPN